MIGAARQRQILQGQTTIARKVYEGIPIEEPWGYQQIHAELKRRGITASLAYNEFQGCIRALKEAGLVREIKAGAFLRIPARSEAANDTQTDIEQLLPEPPMNPVLKEPITAKEKPMPAPTINITPIVTSAKTPIDLLGPLADQIRKISEMAAAAAEQIENIAAELEERAHAESDELKRLRQLKQLLKEI